MIQVTVPDTIDGLEEARRSVEEEYNSPFESTLFLLIMVLVTSTGLF